MFTVNRCMEDNTQTPRRGEDSRLRESSCLARAIMLSLISSEIARLHQSECDSSRLDELPVTVIPEAGGKSVCINCRTGSKVQHRGVREDKGL